jgi:hydrogenase nickel incorporation protein HypA/HybF
MHEFGLCEGVLDAVRTRAAGRQVSGIRVRCGVKHAVDAESMAQAFGFVASGTEADGASVEVVTVPAVVHCHRCGATSETTDLLTACPHCGNGDVVLTGGDDLVLESISYADPPSQAVPGSARAEQPDLH